MKADKTIKCYSWYITQQSVFIYEIALTCTFRSYYLQVYHSEEQVYKVFKSILPLLCAKNFYKEFYRLKTCYDFKFISTTVL